MESNNCISCGKLFSSLKNPGNKRSLSSKLVRIDRTVKDVLQKDLGVNFTPEQKKKRFLCPQCSWIISSFAKSQEASAQALKKIKETAHASHGPTYLAKKLRSPMITPRKIKKLRTVSPQKPQQAPSETGESTTHTLDVQTKKKKKKKLTKAEVDVNRALTYLRLRQYRRGLKLLMSTRSGALKAFSTLLKETVQEEMGIFLRQSESKFGARKGIEEWREFQWNDFLDEMKVHCPLLTSCLLGALTSKSTEETVTLRSRPHVSATPNIGTVMSILAYQNKPKKMANLQELNALQMWLGSCKRQLFTRFNHLGLCVGIHGTMNAIDRIRRNFDSTVFDWRSSITDHLLLPSDVSAADTIPYAESSSTPMSVDTPAQSPVRRVQSPMRHPVIPMLRRPSLVSDSDEPSSILSMSSDINSLPETQGKPCYSICFDNVNQKTTVRHQTRDKKNKMFNMVQAYAALDRINTLHLSDEPSSPDDILGIPLHKLLPCDLDEADLRSQMTVLVERILCQRIPFFSDVEDEVLWHIPHEYSQLSSKKSQLVLLGVLDKDESRVADTIDIVEEYHKYVPVKPDGSPLTIPLHADGLSCERVNDAQNARVNGTTKWQQLQGMIPNIQEWHKRCLLLQDIYDELYTGSSAREVGTLFHLKNYFEQRNVTGNVKESFNYNEEFLEFCTEGYVTLLALHILDMDNLEDIPDVDNKVACLHNISSKIIDRVFQSTSSLVQNITKAGERTQNESYPFCVCKLEKPGAVMVFCDNRNCQRGVWFHIECVDMEEEDIPEGVWYCSSLCKEEKSTRRTKKKTTATSLTDFKMDYVLLLIWRGLSQMSRKDAIRENNGKMILIHWKFDLFQFFARHHPKYFLLCTRLLLAVNGAVSPRLQRTLIWNRTVNKNGGHGKNIEMDLQMEYFNKEYKESVKDAAGHLTADTVARHSQMIGIGKDVSKVYDVSVAGMSGRTIHKGGETDRSKDFAEFIELLLPENIFCAHPGRHFKSFPDVELNVYSKAYPKNIRERLERIRREESRKLRRRNQILE